jgi:hypothetical protein
MCLPFLNLFVRYDALSRGWCVAYVGDANVKTTQVINADFQDSHSLITCFDGFC